MHARDQSSIFSTGGKFHPDYGLLLELHALTLAARSYALLVYWTGPAEVKINFIWPIIILAYSGNSL